jgi:hypothetical protein
MYELFLETWEEEGLSIIPKTIAAIILLCFTVWFGLLKSILNWTIGFGSGTSPRASWSRSLASKRCRNGRVYIERVNEWRVAGRSPAHRKTRRRVESAGGRYKPMSPRSEQRL